MENEKQEKVLSRLEGHLSEAKRIAESEKSVSAQSRVACAKKNLIDARRLKGLGI